MSDNPNLPAQLAPIQFGEDSTHQFKLDFTSPDQLAAEMASFANAEGGTIYVGVSDKGEAVGHDKASVARLNQLISNTASQGVRSPLIVQTENVPLEDGRIVILLKIPKGFDKPYFDKDGVIWLRVGSDKRRVNTKEEVRRLFQASDQFHADELPTKAKIDALDKLRFRDFLKDKRGEEYPDDPEERLRLLRGMSLATEDGHLDLAGVLLFAERPQQFKPQFVVKAARYLGTDVGVLDYDDMEDFKGTLTQQYQDSLAFIMRNLHKIQAGRGVNSPGIPEVPSVVFEELLVNALIHRDYLIDAPIRIFVFDDRVEIISPGHLPNNLTVENILRRNPRHRNPILVSYAAEGLLPYRGLGTGVPRALEFWPKVEFHDDREGNLFVATVARDMELAEKMTVKVARERVGVGENDGETPMNVGESVGGIVKMSGETSVNILNAVKENPNITIPQLAEHIGVTSRTIERNLQRLQENGRIKRVGPDKGGHWEVIE
ncbi:MAG: putative DNA binding domain-containing protein [Fimbriimonadaceae bacterium]|nr:putative DNA binding domain-containing protein [Fimbriimonadaceae bacterium]